MRVMSYGGRLALSGPLRSGISRVFEYREFPGYGGQKSMRLDDWKAVPQKMSQGRLQTELYNLASDVSESTDLATQNPNIMEQMERELIACRVPSIDFPLKPLDPVSQPVRKNNF